MEVIAREVPMLTLISRLGLLSGVLWLMAVAPSAMAAGSPP
jgi:hypothetical protein